MLKRFGLGIVIALALAAELSPQAKCSGCNEGAITGQLQVDAVVTRTWSPITKDAIIGDADEGQMCLGTFCFGQANQTISTTVLNGAVWFHNGSTNVENLAYVWSDSADVPRFVLSETGADLTTYSPRSLIVGPAATIASVDENILCSTHAWLSNLDCDTAGSGADLGVQDDGEFGGSVWVGGSLISGDSANVASATTTALGEGNLFHITGTTTITTLNTCNAANNGRDLTLIFDGILTFTDGNNLKLAGNFVTTADDVIQLSCDGTNWYESDRSIN